MPKEIEISKYCTFWIPNVAHNNFQVIEEVVATADIPGNNGSSYTLKSDITKDHESNTFRIRLNVMEVSTSNVETTYTVYLISVDSCVSGLLEFEYTLNPHLHNKFNKVIHQAYRLIVRHFHKHIYHDPENEGVRQAYLSDNKCYLSSEDNDALCFYLRQVHDLVSEQVEMIHDMAPTYAIENDKDRLRDATDIRNYRKGMELFYRKCENLRGQIPFFNSLLNSPANKSCHILYHEAADDKERELHAIAHNIVNLSDSIINLFERSKTAFYIRNIHSSFDIQSNIKTIADEINETASKNKELIESVDASNKLSSKLGKISLWISVILGALSVALGILGLRNKPMNQTDIKAISNEVANEILRKDSINKNANSSLNPVINKDNKINKN